MERDCESELSKLNIEQNACIYHFGASVIHGQRSNILRLRSNDGVCSKFSLLFYLKKRQDVKNIVTVNRNRTFANSNGNRGY